MFSCMEIFVTRIIIIIIIYIKKSSLLIAVEAVVFEEKFSSLVTYKKTNLYKILKSKFKEQ